VKLIFALVFISVIVSANAAGRLIDSIPPKNNKPVQFASRCISSIPQEPLVIIDEERVKYNQLQNLIPDDIVSITILKDAAAIAIWGSQARNGVIIITTKNASVRKFIIKDFQTGEKVPLATIRFTSATDTLVAVANEDGILLTDKLKPGIKYEMTATSAGYKSFTIAVKEKEQEILLEKDIKENENVLVKATYCFLFSRCWICCRGTVTLSKYVKTGDKKPSAAEIIKPLYPNPVRRSGVYNLELENDRDETMQLSVITLDGRMIVLQSQKISKGLNHLSMVAESKWAAGIYIVQLRNEKGTVIRQEKLMIQ
jgi:TonB-dependent SusC/RagA subfamily outer membrane receptor